MIKWLKNKYNNWKLERQLNKEIDSTVMQVNDLFDAIREEQEAVKALYQEGINKVKNKLSFIADKERFLEKTDDLVKFAEGEDLAVKEQREQLKEIFIFKKEKPKEQMINDRIEMYYKLQKYNEERSLIKAIKAARKEGNEKRTKQLENEWRAKYRPFKKN